MLGRVLTTSELLCILISLHNFVSSFLIGSIPPKRRIQSLIKTEEEKEEEKEANTREVIFLNLFLLILTP